MDFFNFFCCSNTENEPYEPIDTTHPAIPLAETADTTSIAFIASPVRNDNDGQGNQDNLEQYDESVQKDEEGVNPVNNSYNQKAVCKSMESNILASRKSGK